MTSFVFGTGFETGTVTIPLLDYESSYSGVSAGGMTGSYYLGCYAHNGGGWFLYRIPSSSEYWIGAWIMWNGTNVISLLLADNSKIALRVNGSGPINIVTGSVTTTSATVISTSALSYPISVWTNVQIHVIIDNSSGLFEVKLGGNIAFSFSGDTQVGSSDQIVGVIFGGYSGFEGHGGDSTLRVDDFVVASDGYPGDVRFEALSVTSDVDSEWEPSTGASNYAMVDEVPPSDTDYNKSDEEGEKDLFEVSNFNPVNSDGMGKTPLFVNLWARARKNTADTQQLIMRTVSGATTRDVTKDVETYFAYNLDMMETNPNGNVAWTVSSVDGIRVGYESILGDD